MNLFQNLFDRQRSLFATGKTRSYAWRIEQLDRMARSLSENEEALQRAVGQDFKTATQEQFFETFACLGEVAFQKGQLKGWMAPVEAPLPTAIAATGHRGVARHQRLHVLSRSAVCATTASDSHGGDRLARDHPGLEEARCSFPPVWLLAIDSPDLPSSVL